MPTPRLFALALSLAVTACSTPWLGADARIQVGGKPAVIPSEEIPKLRGMWSSESVAVARNSGFSESYWLSAMDLIARMHMASGTPCRRLDLRSVAPHPATEFVLASAQDGSPGQTVMPARVEVWRLEACGVPGTVRVYDDKLKPDMKVGITPLRER